MSQLSKSKSKTDNAGDLFRISNRILFLDFNMCDKNFTEDIDAFGNNANAKTICEKGSAQSKAQQAINEASMAKEHGKYRIDQAGYDAKARIDEASLNAQDSVDEHSRRLKANLAQNSIVNPRAPCTQPGCVSQTGCTHT